MNVKVTISTKGNLPPTEFFKKLENELNVRLPKHTAASYKAMVIDNINSNKFGFRLSDSWRRRKIAKGLDLRPFVATGEYKNSISILTRNRHLSVGFKRNDIHKSGLRVGYLARLLEYGVPDRGLPPRPLWRKTSEVFFKDYRKFIQKYLSERL